MPEREKCPWCGSEISRERFHEIQNRIREEEKRQLASVQAETRKKLQEEFEAEIARKTARIQQKFAAEAEQKIASIAAERDGALLRIKQGEARESSIRQKALEEAEKQRKKELEQQREALEKDRDKQLMKVQADRNRERETYEKKFSEMQRHLQRKTANEVGEVAEVDLFDELREQFPEDRIARIKKGQPGADIKHEVMYKGQRCGCILYDSKNRQSWQNGYITKLRQDQVEARAEHAILATTVFPSGKRELCIESDIVVVNPARAVHVATLLRQAMVMMHIRGLSLQERATKTSRLYGLITSESYTRRFQEAVKISADILDLDVEEQKAHGIVWKKRGTLATRMRNALRQIETDVAAIVEDGLDTSTPPPRQPARVTGLQIAAVAEEGK